MTGILIMSLCALSQVLRTFLYTHFINSKTHIYLHFNISEALSHFTWQQFYFCS